MFRCKICNGTKVYALELRTDYNNFRNITPYNDSEHYGKYVTNDDLPYYLNMDYCEDCKEIVEIYDDESKTNKITIL